MVREPMDRIRYFGVALPVARKMESGGSILQPLRVAIGERMVVALVLPVMKGVSVFVVAIIV